jgi:hypothetical protein
MRWLVGWITLMLIGTACLADAEQLPDSTVEPTATSATRAPTSVTRGGVSSTVNVRSQDGDGSLTCWASPAVGGPEGLRFRESGEAFGLVDPLTGMYGHAAAWGDVDSDMRPDLVVGTFANRRPENYLVRGAEGPSPDRLLLATDHGFVGADGFPEQRGRTSGAVFVDLDGDTDLDLVLSRNADGRGEDLATTQVFRNTGSSFEPDAASGLDPRIGGRSVGVLDVDGDGALDLLIVEDHRSGGSSRLYRNLGSLRFEDKTAAWGMPLDVHGLGVATGDLNGDRRTDVFVAGSNRLFVGSAEGLSEVHAPELAWNPLGPEDDVAGAAIADVNRDGLLDLVVGHHYNSTLSQDAPQPVRLYLNRTAHAGSEPVFEDVTEPAGLSALPTKAPHVELVDFDNDGWPDLFTTASAAEGREAAVFHHLGLVGGVPRFEAPEGLGAEQYWVTGPTADVDRDGRVDLLLVEWEPAKPSMLMLNESGSGHWLDISVATELGGGIGSRVDVYEEGTGRLIGSREIVASVGYTAGVEQIAHFGLGKADVVDFVVTPPPPHSPVRLESIEVDRHLRVPEGCGE